jgi:tetratricopeptide (TPR) repeat protein
MGWQEDAIQYYEKALLIRPDADNLRLALAETQVGYGHFDRAKEHLEWLHKRQPENPSVLFGLARCAAATGANDKALQLLNQLLAANPNNWLALNERGKLAVQCDRPEDALSDLRKADSLAPADVAPTHLVGCLHLLGKLADRNRSAELGDLIREKAPNDPELRYEMGCVLLRLGKQRDAVHWFRTALEKDPKHRKTHEALVKFFQSVNAFEQAQHHQRILQQL